MKTKLQNLGFTLAHLQIVVVSFVLVGGLIIAQSNISLKSIFANADDSKAVLTYEQARAQVVKANGFDQLEDNSAANAEADKQMALIDRSLDDGQVLGEMTGIGNIPEANQIFSQESINQIRVRTIANPTQADFDKYVANISYIESQYGLLTMLANINSGDPDTIKSAQEQAKNMLKLFPLVDVPAPMVEYHRYKMMYYNSLINIGDVWLKARPDTDLQPESTMMFSIMTKLDNLRTSLNQSYNTHL